MPAGSRSCEHNSARRNSEIFGVDVIRKLGGPRANAKTTKILTTKYIDHRKETVMTTEELNEIVKWGRREVELVRRKQALEAEVASAMLEPGLDTSAADNDRIGRAAVELRAIDLAIRTAQERRVEGLKAIRENGIRALQDQMAEVRKELSALSKEVEMHKHALSEMLGTPIEAVCAIPGQRSRLQHMTIMLLGLTDQIGSRQGAPIPSSGTIDIMDNTGTADEAALSVLSTPSTCPSAEAILAWFAGFGKTAGQRRVYVVWRDGQIDAKVSFVRSLEAACR